MIVSCLKKHGTTISVAGIFIGYMYDWYKWYRITRMTRGFLADNYTVFMDYLDTASEKHKTNVAKFKWLFQSMLIGITYFTHKDRQVGDDFIDVVLSDPANRRECVRLIHMVINETKNIFKDEHVVVSHIGNIEAVVNGAHADFISEDIVYDNETDIIKYCIPIVLQMRDLIKDDVDALEKILFTDSK